MGCRYVSCYLRGAVSNPKSSYSDKYEATEFLKRYNALREDKAADTNKAELEDSLRFLSELLSKIHGRPVYILIDECDKTVNHLLEADNPDHELIKKTTELMSNISLLVVKTTII
ncbi:MAG: N-succinylarginine dihydrolase [Candidatus Midichloria mitochondrii]|uniref:N-succinylarginine dihydrolase n=2 Tax=Candidatus Midichloria mitochondrii TaxID=234827 RepID=F7XUR3_MIDMI|nr:N-succinylarginine dihydrolase [Candidatus Midichloria mitochondrii IricVA]